MKSVQKNPSLAELQKRFHARVAKSGSSRVDRLGWVARRAPLSRAERVSIYSYAYLARLTEALRDDYPRVARVVGEREFGRLAAAYFERYPSVFRNINDVGAKFPRFVASRLAPGVAELARFEWALVEAFYAPPRVLKPGSKIVLASGARLLMSRWDIESNRLLRRKKAVAFLVYRNAVGASRWVRLEAGDRRWVQALALPVLPDSLGRGIQGPRLERLAERLQKWATLGVIELTG